MSVADRQNILDIVDIFTPKKQKTLRYNNNIITLRYICTPMIAKKVIIKCIYLLQKYIFTIKCHYFQTGVCFGFLQAFNCSENSSSYTYIYIYIYIQFFTHFICNSPLIRFISKTLELSKYHCSKKICHCI